MAKKQKKKKKHPAFRFFCAIGDVNSTDHFRELAAKMHSVFIDGTQSCSLFDAFTGANAFVYLFDFQHYDQIRSQIDSFSQNQRFPPLIYIYGGCPFFITPISFPDYVGIWGWDTIDEVLSKMNISRSRIRR